MVSLALDDIHSNVCVVAVRDNDAVVMKGDLMKATLVMARLYVADFNKKVSKVVHCGSYGDLVPRFLAFLVSRRQRSHCFFLVCWDEDCNPG